MREDGRPGRRAGSRVVAAIQAVAGSQTVVGSRMVAAIQAVAGSQTVVGSRMVAAIQAVAGSPAVAAIQIVVGSRAAMGGRTPCRMVGGSMAGPTGALRRPGG